MTEEHEVLGLLTYMLERPGQSLEARLDQALRLLCKHRSESLTRSIRPADNVVPEGPFAGLVLSVVAEGCSLPKMLGSYEEELHETIASFAGLGFSRVVNIGCAEGYYAVGLARALGIPVLAHDSDPNAQQACTKLATDNGVGELVKVGGLVEHDDLEKIAGQGTLVVCDIEGSEVELLDPDRVPALRASHLLVETHDVFRQNCRSTLLARFRDSHSIERIERRGRDHARYPALQDRDQIDQMLALWEWRVGDNDWLWMRPTASRSAL